MDSRQLDRFADRLLEMAIAQQKQAAALERIAAAVEQMALAHKPVVIPRTPRSDMVYGPGSWEGPDGPVKLDPKRTR